MNLYLRFTLLLLKRLLIFKKISPLDLCETNFWVNLFDLDINMHVNNGRYLSIMDLGRIDLLLKSKCFWKLLFNGYYPVVVSESIRFKKALMPFQFFKIKTRIIHWTEKDVYIQQDFVRGKTVVAEGYLKARFLHRQRGSVSTSQLFKILGLTYESLPSSKKAEALDQLTSQLTQSSLL